MEVETAHIPKHEVLCEGSTQYRLAHALSPLRIPVLANLPQVYSISYVYPEPYDTWRNNFCEVAYPQKCHACEGGHHIHVEWTE